MSLTRKQWNIAANVLRYLGFVSFASTMILLLLVSMYYAAKRPHSPQQEFGWTVLLPGSPASALYGSAQDVALLDRLFFGLIASGLPIAAGESILIYKLNIDRSGGRIDPFLNSRR